MGSAPQSCLVRTASDLGHRAASGHVPAFGACNNPHRTQKSKP